MIECSILISIYDLVGLSQFASTRVAYNVEISHYKIRFDNLVFY